MKFIKKCPVLTLLISLGLLFTIIGFAGIKSIYAQQDYDPLKAPVLSVMFTGINDGIYPWQMFTGRDTEAMAQKSADDSGTVSGQEILTADSDRKSSSSSAADQSPGTEASALPEQGALPEAEASALPEPETLTEAPAASGADVLPKASPQPEAIPEGRLEPLRESTREEYLNHISADIYGDAGVKRAFEYEFATVDEGYFDDALFIGDSRSVGLRDYTDLSEHADFYCETSLTIYEVLEENFKGQGTIPEALAAKDYGKIYLMVGINELGRGTTEDFMEQYTKVVDTLHELEPEALIFIQGIMRVSGEKNSSDAIFNNSNINARNNAIATLADNQQFFYIDVNEAVCDDQGDLNEEYTFDQIHLLGVYNDIWKQFLLAHGVK